MRGEQLLAREAAPCLCDEVLQLCAVHGREADEDRREAAVVVSEEKASGAVDMRNCCSMSSTGLRTRTSASRRRDMNLPRTLNAGVPKLVPSCTPGSASIIVWTSSKVTPRGPGLHEVAIGRSVSARNASRSARVELPVHAVDPIT